MSAAVTARTIPAEATSFSWTRATPSAISQPTPLGGAVPNGLPHAISVSLPTWKDVVGYEEGEKRVVDSMCTGYPRFFINKMIQKLAIICQVKFGKPDEQCLLFPTSGIGESCRKFMLNHSPTPLSIRLVRWLIAPVDQPYAPEEDCVVLHIVFFPSESFGLGKQFWQHTGLGISSRVAERCLALLGPREPGLIKSIPINPTRQRSSKNKHYLVPGIATQEDEEDEVMTAEHTTYLEERYGRNLPRSDANLAKKTLRRRIAGVLARDSDPTQSPSQAAFIKDTAPTARRVENLTEDDVYLFPTGMSSIWTAHQLALATRQSAKSVCFGFPYTDTLKILQKWGPGCHFFGHGTDADLDAFETLLESGERILALFCEFPSNPLLRSPDLRRLRELANKHDFLIVCDETIGNFANVEVLPWVDMVVSSLTKVFSGETNVMGGGLVLNPHAPHYQSLKKGLADIYEDCYWGEDAIYLERNSRDFSKRVKIISDNAEAVVDLLRSRSLDHYTQTQPSAVPAHVAVKSVYYPKYMTREHYDACLIPGGGYGGLLSVTFTSERASQAFFDALRCEKGPSLGTNFTLACPYTILAHYTELDWADQYGVERGLVRASVGLEERAVLQSWFNEAVQAAEDAVKEEREAEALNPAK